MRIFLAGMNGIHGIVENAVVLGRRCSVEKWGGYDQIIHDHRPFILESFYYCDADTERLIPHCINISCNRYFV